MILELRKFDLDLHAALETFPLVLGLFACLPLIQWGDYFGSIERAFLPLN